jgi:hypothetical protein
MLTIPSPLEAQFQEGLRSENGDAREWRRRQKSKEGYSINFNQFSRPMTSPVSTKNITPWAHL